MTEIDQGKNEHISKVQKFKSKKHEKHLSNNMFIDENNTSGEGEESGKNSKYKGIQKVAKNKFKSKSHIP